MGLSIDGIAIVDKITSETSLPSALLTLGGRRYKFEFSDAEVEALGQAARFLKKIESATAFEWGTDEASKVRAVRIGDEWVVVGSQRDAPKFSREDAIEKAETTSFLIEYDKKYPEKAAQELNKIESENQLKVKLNNFGTFHNLKTELINGNSDTKKTILKELGVLDNWGQLTKTYWDFNTSFCYLAVQENEMFHSLNETQQKIVYQVARIVSGKLSNSRTYEFAGSCPNVKVVTILMGRAENLSAEEIEGIHSFAESQNYWFHPSIRNSGSNRDLESYFLTHCRNVKIPDKFTEEQERAVEKIKNLAKYINRSNMPGGILNGYYCEYNKTAHGVSEVIDAVLAARWICQAHLYWQHEIAEVLAFCYKHEFWHTSTSEGIWID